MENLTPEQQSLITRVQEIVDQGKSSTLDGVRAEMKKALDQVTGGMKAPVPADVIARAQAAGAEAGKAPEQVAETLKSLNGLLGAVAAVRAKVAEEPSFLVRLGVQRGYKPAPTQISKEQALNAIAAISGSIVETARTEGPEAEVLAQAMIGITAFGVEHAHRRGLIEQPRKGLSAWQIVGLSLGGAALAAGAVTGGMYVAEVGPFAPKNEE